MPPVARPGGSARVVAGLVLAFGTTGAFAEAGAGRHVKASLLAETDGVRPGQPLTVGIRLEMEKGWHTYWRNPGDAGLPTRVKWDLPEGLTGGEILWPFPVRFSTGPVRSYGYEREVLLLVEIRVPPSLGPGEVRLSGRVDWLECQEACLPGKADVTLALPVRASVAPGPHAPLFAQARRRLPSRDPAWRFSASPPGQGLSLVVRPPRGLAPARGLLLPRDPAPRRLRPAAGARSGRGGLPPLARPGPERRALQPAGGRPGRRNGKWNRRPGGGRAPGLRPRQDLDQGRAVAGSSTSARRSQGGSPGVHSIL